MRNKMKRTGRGIFAAMFVMAMVLLQVYGVSAENTSYQAIDGIVVYGSGEASIVIEGNAGQSLAGKQFRLHRLFEAENAIGLESIDYTINPIYKAVLQRMVGEKLDKSADAVTEYEIIDYLVSMNTEVLEGAQAQQSTESRHGEYRHFVEMLAEELAKENIVGNPIDIKGTKANNTVEITGLPYGYYMIEDVSETEGEHTALSMPMLSTTNPTSTMHLKADYPTVTAKIYEDIYGWNDIADYDIGKKGTYRYQSQIPDINGYQTYYYTWHTETDEALTLQEDTIRISISGVQDTEDKTYLLKSEEFNINKDTSNHSFTIEIKDIKAIVDREFQNLNSKQENTYGQTVTVTYQATLNDKAALDTGRPGYETDVRLEFSNNPYASGADETGFTPWDTVVCFTYQLQVQKINNYGTKLEGAKFRLYRDRECKDEILVKKMGERYHIIHPDSVDDESRQLAVEMVSNEDGRFGIYGLDANWYYLKEVEAPMGYRPLTEPIEVLISAATDHDRDNYIKGDGAKDGLLYFSASATISTFTDGKWETAKQTLDINQEECSVALSVVNHVGRKLPITGTAAVLIVTVSGIALVGVAMLRGRKKHE